MTCMFGVSQRNSVRTSAPQREVSNNRKADKTLRVPEWEELYTINARTRGDVARVVPTDILDNGKIMDRTNRVSGSESR